MVMMGMMVLSNCSSASSGVIPQLGMAIFLDPLFSVAATALRPRLNHNFLGQHLRSSEQH
jgi:hypothetical protein